MTGATKILSICGALLFLAYELLLRRRDTDAATWKSGDGDQGSTRLILASYLAVLAVNIAFGRAAYAHVEPMWRWVGVALLAAGLALRAWAMTTLGRYYTRTLRAVDEQHVIEHGPYRLVRHPGYTGSLLVWTGYALGLGSWIATAITASLLCAVYLWRINAEETLLRDSLGEQYTAYERHTKRLVPFVY